MSKKWKIVAILVALIIALGVTASASGLPTLRDMLLEGIPYTVTAEEETVDRGHFAYVVSAVS